VDNTYRHLRLGWPDILLFSVILTRHDGGATLTVTLRVIGVALHFGVSALD